VGKRRKVKTARPDRYFRKANDGFAPGQLRVWMTGLSRETPVELLSKIEETGREKRARGPYDSFDRWTVEMLLTGEIKIVSTQELGRLMSEMEVLAWASR
jgi:hypothetical protein